MDKEFTIKELLLKAQKRLQAKNIEGALLAPELILAKLLKVSKEYLYTYPEKKLPSSLSKHFFELLARREQKEPLAYILGKKDFYDLELEVNPHVLIPRPETEMIIDLVKEKFKSNQKFLFADLGTGSGCIAITLAKHFPLAKGLCVDLSYLALKLAYKNAKKYKVNSRLIFTQQNLMRFACSKPLDLIVSNPPYLSVKDLEQAPGEVRNFEPKLALLGGTKGLKFYPFLRQIITHYLKPKGLFIAECGYNQAKELKKIFSNFSQLKIIKDLQKLDRFLFIEK